MLKDKTGSVDPVGVIWGGARANGNKVFTQRGSFPLRLLEKGDEVAHFVDSSLMEKKTELPLLSRANTGSSLAKYLGVLLLTFPHLIPTATSWSEKTFDGRPFHISNRPPRPGWGEGGRTRLREKAKRRHRSYIVARRVPEAERAKHRLPCHARWGRH